jgi:hypothetical protein
LDDIAVARLSHHDGHATWALTIAGCAMAALRVRLGGLLSPPGDLVAAILEPERAICRAVFLT